MARMVYCLLVTFFVILTAYIRANISEESNLMRFMWMTPVQSVQLSKLTSSQTANKLISALQRSTLNYFQEYILHKGALDKDATVSDGFYLYQQSQSLVYKKCLLEKETQDWQSCPHYLPSSMQQLVPIIKSLLLGYLQQSMIEESPLYDVLNSPLELEKSLFLWTSIHQNGTFHAAHHHQNSAISGVFYIQVPEGAGDIVFYDPRGALPPFGKTLHIKPEVGKIVVFPSWLLHEVQPTISTKSRISISFNIDGKWESTSDVNTAFVLS